VSATVTFDQLAVGDRFLFRDEKHGGGRWGVRFRVKVAATKYEAYWSDGQVTSHGPVEPKVRVTRAWR
jgi:hypothetical protein